MQVQRQNAQPPTLSIFLFGQIVHRTIRIRPNSLRRLFSTSLVIYVAGHPLLNRKCTGLPGCSRFWNDRYCIRWGV